MQVVVESLLTHYVSKGKGGKYILCLHGWGDDSSTFSDIQEDLSSRYTVVCLDLPGFGQTQMPPKVWALADYAKFVGAFTEKIQAEKLAAVVAHSNGAAVAITAVSSKVINPEKLILLGAAGIRDTQKLRKLLLKTVAKTGKVATFWLPARHKKKLQKALYGAAGSDMFVVPHLQETFKQTVREDVQKVAATITTPTLLIYGENDRATPVAYGALYERLMPHAVLKIVKDAEHFVHHDAAKQTLRLIKEFLK